jgi:lactoylglutathione lyase
MRIHHTNISVSDPVASLTFYRRLGLELAGCLRLDPRYLLYLGVPGQESPTLELMINPDAAPHERSPGSGHIALSVDDLDAVLAHLAEAGTKPERPPFHPGDRPDLRVCFVVDPDGIRVELIDGPFATPQDPVPESIPQR